MEHEAVYRLIREEKSVKRLFEICYQEDEYYFWIAIVKTGRLSTRRLLEISDMPFSNNVYRYVLEAIVKTGKLTFPALLKLGKKANKRNTDVWETIVSMLNLDQLSVKQLKKLGNAAGTHGGVWQPIVGTGKLSAEELLNIKAPYFGVVRAIIHSGKLSFKQLMQCARKDGTTYSLNYIEELNLTSEQLKVVEAQAEHAWKPDPDVMLA